MLIAINGKIGSGKDTVGKIIQHLTSEWADEEFQDTDMLNVRSNWKIKKFAGKLKQIASLLTGIDVEKFEDQEFKKTLLGTEWSVVDKNPLNSIEPFKDIDFARLISVREFLQKLGTEAMRDGLHTNVWVNALFADYVPISDISKSNTYTDDRLQHGYKGTKIWRTYHNIKQRCTNTKHPRYNDYGGRSITMCKEWLNDINSFINWAIENGYNESLTIDRIDNDKGYSPDNCRCVSYSVQSINTSLRKDNTSGYRGVTKDRHNWRAQIQIKGKQKFLGYFDTAEEASEVYENAFMEREGLYLDEEKSNLIYPSWCITDMRFPNELKAVEDRDGITIRIERGGSTNQLGNLHPSEIALDDATFDYIIDNNSDIQSLIKQVKYILINENIL